MPDQPLKVAGNRWSRRSRFYWFHCRPKAGNNAAKLLDFFTGESIIVYAQVIQLTNILVAETLGGYADSRSP